MHLEVSLRIPQPVESELRKVLSMQLVRSEVSTEPNADSSGSTDEDDYATVDMMISAALAAVMDSTAEEAEEFIGDSLEALVRLPTRGTQMQRLIGAVNYASQVSARSHDYASTFRQEYSPSITDG